MARLDAGLKWGWKELWGYSTSESTTWAWRSGREFQKKPSRLIVLGQDNSGRLKRAPFLTRVVCMLIACQFSGYATLITPKLVLVRSMQVVGLRSSSLPVQLSPMKFPTYWMIGKEVLSAVTGYFSCELYFVSYNYNVHSKCICKVPRKKEEKTDRPKQETRCCGEESHVEFSFFWFNSTE